ncbi:MAG TPA: diacylglycerol kinase family protein [Acidimicrobiia bacterium]|jgi:diacylglycerol kinase family enzyme
MRIMLIANAVASSYSARRRVVVRKALAADHDLEFVETEHRGHATELAAKAAAAGFDVVVVLAGDGTLNEAANGLVGTSTMLAPLPGGSTNVYAQTIGVPTDPVDAASVLLQSLETDSTTRIGVGRVNERHFLFHCGMGFDAAVIRRVERFDPRLKRHAAHPVYVAAAFDTWLRGFDRTTPGFDIDLGDERLEGVYFAIAHKTSPYTFLGNRPLHVEPAAGLHTPLAITAFRRFDVVTMLGGAASAMASGRFLRRRRGIERRTDVERCVVLGRTPIPHQVDGDDLGDAARLVISYVPDAITLVTPTTVDAPT